MKYILWVFIIISAFFFALFCFFLKKKIKINGNSSFITKHFLTYTSIILAFFSGGKIGCSSLNQLNTRDRGVIMQEKIKNLNQYSEWQKIKTEWNNIYLIDNTEDTEFDKIISKKKNENFHNFNVLINKGFFTKPAVLLFNNIYGDRLYHILRSGNGKDKSGMPVIRMSCYDMPEEYYKNMLTREEVEKKLEELSIISKKGLLKDEVLNQAKNNLLKHLEIILLFHDLMEKQKEYSKDWDKYRDIFFKERDYIVRFLETKQNKIIIKDDLKIRNELNQVLEIILLIYYEK